MPPSPATTPEREQRVLAFVRRFAEASAGLDEDALAGCFSPTFLVADRSGARPVDRETFLRALPHREKAFAAAGVGRARLDAVEVTALDDAYALARTLWSAPRRDGGAPLRLESSFLLHEDRGRLRAVLYLNHRGLADGNHPGPGGGSHPDLAGGSHRGAVGADPVR
jgi:hypothetical protein